MQNRGRRLVKFPYSKKNVAWLDAFQVPTLYRRSFHFPASEHWCVTNRETKELLLAIREMNEIVVDRSVCLPWTTFKPCTKR